MTRNVSVSQFSDDVISCQTWHSCLGDRQIVVLSKKAANVDTGAVDDDNDVDTHADVDVVDVATGCGSPTQQIEVKMATRLSVEINVTQSTLPF